MQQPVWADNASIMEQYAEVMRKNEKLKDEVKFWKQVAETQSTFAGQIDEEHKKMKAQVEQMQVSYSLLKQLYNAQVNSNMKSACMQLKTIKRLTNDKFEFMR